MKKKDNRKPVGRQLTLDDFKKNEELLLDNMKSAFKEVNNATLEWLRTPQAEEYYKRRGQQLAKFMSESGIREEWDNIIHKRATRGADLTSQIYDYARKLGRQQELREYTETETIAMNKLCDYNYELIRNVTNDQVSSIRRYLIQDYAEGNNPRRTSMKAELEHLQLEPINGWTPQQRAEVIARTESARALDTATLESYRADGITMVSLYGDYNDGKCDECAKYGMGSTEYPNGVPIEDALEIGVPHPNCRCVWLPETRIDNDKKEE